MLALLQRVQFEFSGIHQHLRVRIKKGIEGALELTKGILYALFVGPRVVQILKPGRQLEQHEFEQYKFNQRLF